MILFIVFNKFLGDFESKIPIFLYLLFLRVRLPAVSLKTFLLRIHPTLILASILEKTRLTVFPSLVDPDPCFTIINKQF